MLWHRVSGHSSSSSYDPISFTSSIVVVITCCAPTPCIGGDRHDTTLLHVQLYRNHCLLRTHHHLGLFLNRWSRSFFWHLPVRSLIVVNSWLFNLQNKHTGRVSYSYNFQDAIADHLGWFKESTQDGKLCEGSLKAKGEKVRRGKLDLDGLGTVEEYIEWGKDLENWAGCARFLPLLWWFLVPTNMYYDRSLTLTSVTPCRSSTLPIFILASFHIDLLGHCNIFMPNAKRIRTLM